MAGSPRALIRRICRRRRHCSRRWEPSARPRAGAVEGWSMTFYDVLAQVLELLQREGLVPYRALKLQFHLDDDYLEGLKEELIEAKRVAIDEGGKVLAWVGPPLRSRHAARRPGPRPSGRQTSRPRLARSPTPPGTWPSASWPSRRRWRRRGRLTASARPLPPSSPTSRAPWHCWRTWTPRRRGASSILPCSA